MVDLLSPRLTPLPSRLRLEEKIVADHVNYTLTLCAPGTERRIGLLVANDPINWLDLWGLAPFHPMPPGPNYNNVDDPAFQKDVPSSPGTQIVDFVFTTGGGRAAVGAAQAGSGFKNMLRVL